MTDGPEKREGGDIPAGSGDDEDRVSFVGESRVRITDPATLDILKSVIDTGNAVYITRRGKLAGMIIAVSPHELISNYLRNNPDLAAQLEDQAAHPERALPASAFDWSQRLDLDRLENTVGDPEQGPGSREQPQGHA